MAGSRRARVAPGSGPWIAEERLSASQIAHEEIDEFTFSARNDFEWLNEHMGDIFSENPINVADIFKTPGKLRGKTPRTNRKADPAESRMPLSNIFSATPKGASNPFALASNPRSQITNVPIATDASPKSPLAALASPTPDQQAVSLSPSQSTSPSRPVRVASPAKPSNWDSGYHGSREMMDVDPCDLDQGNQEDQENNQENNPEDPTLPFSQPNSPGPEAVAHPSSPHDEPLQQNSILQSPERVGPAEEALDEDEGMGEEEEEEAMDYFNANVGGFMSPPTALSHPESTTPAGSPIAQLPAQLPAQSPKKPASPLKSSSVKSPTAEHNIVEHEPEEHNSEAPNSDAQNSEDHHENHHKGHNMIDQADTHIPPTNESDQATEAIIDEDIGSPSDGSSPIRPIVRKSSLNFASLPAREPMTHKSIGNRISRTSYINRQTGGKSLGHQSRLGESDQEDNDDMDVDDEHDVLPQRNEEPTDASIHNKTYTQRLQDQISQLGKSQANTIRSSKSLAENIISAAAAQQTNGISAPTTASQAPPTPKRPTASKTHTTPGAFPEDDDEPLGSPDDASGLNSPRPGMPKSHSADIMEGVSGNSTVSGGEFAMPKTRSRTTRSKSPERPVDETPLSKGHHKSSSVPVLPQMAGQSFPNANSIHKTVSASTLQLAPVSEAEDDRPSTPSKSPARNARDSPLKHVKNKLSSILKSSRGLLASSAALSAEGKSSIMSPSTTRLGLQHAASNMTLGHQYEQDAQPLYPDLSQQAAEVQSITGTASPARTNSRRTRASVEKEKAEERRKKDEAKEARLQAEQMEKLEKAREKEREKARIFNEEQERIAAAERQLAAQKEQERREQEKKEQERREQEKREQEKREQEKKEAAAAPAPASIPSSPSKATRSSPRKAKPEVETIALVEHTSDDDDDDDDDLEMVDAPTNMPPPSLPRSGIPSSASKPREIKRPMKPSKDMTIKAKQAPTVISVKMGSQHLQFHPSNSTLASNLQDTLGTGVSQSQIKPKASQPSTQHKPSNSVNSFASSQSSTGRPKALDLAARRREQEEREAQRKKDQKAEMERKRAAKLEEERHQKKREMDKQKEEERKQAAAAAAQVEAKKQAQRQAMLEKAKVTRAPPPPVRSVNGLPDHKSIQASEAASSSRPPSRMNLPTARSQDDFGRSINAGLANTTKANSKRQLQQDTKDTKRMRMTDEFNDDEMQTQPSLKGAPMRPSNASKKVTAGSMMPASQKAKASDNKSMFPAGYTNAPPSATRDLFKATVTSQHHSQVKGGHAVDITQLAKGPIPFSTTGGHSLKTPARPATSKTLAKSAPRSSPRFQNGENIELPEINTDDEDEYDDEEPKMFASWTDSPALRRALVEQETKDPLQVFGIPAPLNMEEVFSKSKDRWHKFRARTSSANWSGADRLTDDEIRKDMAARERLRREGAWSFEMSKEML